VVVSKHERYSHGLPKRPAEGKNNTAEYSKFRIRNDDILYDLPFCRAKGIRRFLDDCRCKIEGVS
jgi:hypothetical protein